MQAPFLVILAVVALGLLYVVVPVVVGTYRRFAGTKIPTCPATHAIAAVDLDATHAALTAAIGAPKLRVKNCSRWPEHRGCAQECVHEVESDPLTTSMPSTSRA
jgi:hypothetical protein